MSTEYATVAQFMTACMDEDEKIARQVLADIEAKRHVVNLWLDPAKIEHWGRSGRDPGEVMADIAAATMIDEVVRLLAEAYGSRPGYKQEWRIF